jgi:hypothetical protein
MRLSQWLVFVFAGCAIILNLGHVGIAQDQEKRRIVVELDDTQVIQMKSKKTFCT